MKLIMIAFLAMFIAGCCKPNQPPTFFCKLRERSVDCAKEIGSTGAADLTSRVLDAIRGNGWEPALQSLVDTFGDAAICVIGGLPEVFSKKPAAGIEELTQRTKDLEKAGAFLQSRGLKVKK